MQSNIAYYVYKLISWIFLIDVKTCPGMSWKFPFFCYLSSKVLEFLFLFLEEREKYSGKSWKVLEFGRVICVVTIFYRYVFINSNVARFYDGTSIFLETSSLGDCQARLNSPDFHFQKIRYLSCNYYCWLLYTVDEDYKLISIFVSRI